jgi:hypothetical protein
MQPVRAHRTESQLIQAIAVTQFRVRELSSCRARAGIALGRCDHEAGARKMDTDLADRPSQLIWQRICPQAQARGELSARLSAVRACSAPRGVWSQNSDPPGGGVSKLGT